MHLRPSASASARANRQCQCRRGRSPHRDRQRLRFLRLRPLWCLSDRASLQCQRRRGQSPQRQCRGMHRALLPTSASASARRRGSGVVLGHTKRGEVAFAEVAFAEGPVQKGLLGLKNFDDKTHRQHHGPHSVQEVLTRRIRSLKDGTVKAPREAPPPHNERSRRAAWRCHDARGHART